MRREATRVLVTGGAGFIGGHLVRSLVAAGHSVRVLDDLSAGSRDRLTGLAVELLQADVRNPAAVRRALDGAEVVFHLAGVHGPTGRLADAGAIQRSEEVNVCGTLNLLQAACEARPGRIVLAGSGAVYGRVSAYLLHEELTPAPATPDGVQRLAIEHYARVFQETHRLPTVVLRLFRLFGPGEAWDSPGAGLVPKLCHAALEGASPLIVGDGRQTRDFVYVDNAVAALLAAASIPAVEGRVFNVASGEAVGIAHLWALVCELAGRRRDAPVPTYAPAPPWEPAHVRVSITRAARGLGYAPAVRLREGLRRTVDHYRALHRAQATGENAWFSPPASTALSSERPGGSWPRPARAVPPPPPPTGIRGAFRPTAAAAAEIEIEPEDLVEIDRPAADLDVSWAPVPGPGGAG